MTRDPSKLINSEPVQKLAEAFDLEMPQYYLKITGYGLDDQGRIVIDTIKVFDSKGKFLKLADNKKVMNGIEKFPVYFDKNGS